MGADRKSAQHANIMYKLIEGFNFSMQNPREDPGVQ